MTKSITLSLPYNYLSASKKETHFSERGAVMLRSVVDQHLVMAGANKYICRARIAEKH